MQEPLDGLAKHVQCCLLLTCSVDAAHAQAVADFSLLLCRARRASLHSCCRARWAPAWARQACRAPA